MKTVIRRVAESTPVELDEIDIDCSADLKQKYGEEVPVLFINGRKAFKYRLSAKQVSLLQVKYFAISTKRLQAFIPCERRL
jgi:hypothetical protein